MTGARADERFVIPPGSETLTTLLIVRALLENKASKGSSASRAQIQQTLDQKSELINSGYERVGIKREAFDKLAGDLTMRWARDGESMEALNGKTYALDPSTMVIADDKGAHGIGGVMGGEHSSVTEGTTSVFIESALFSAGMVAATGRKLNLQSDARYRFERGLDQTSPKIGRAHV